MTIFNIRDLTMKEEMDRKSMLAVHGGIIGGCVDIRTDTITGIVKHVHEIAYGHEPASCLANQQLHHYTVHPAGWK